MAPAPNGLHGWRGGESFGLAIDSSAGKIYWTEAYGYDSGKIRRSNLDGSSTEDFLAGLSVPYQVALDVSAGNIYWSDQYSVNCANLNGSNAHSLHSVEYAAIALDSTAGKIYWAGYYAGVIQRSNLDGSQVENIITGLNSPFSIALDTINDKIYWSENQTGYIRRANLDGSNMQSIRPDNGLAFGIALDTDAGKIYWSTDNLIEPELSTMIRRANLDFTGIEYAFEGWAYSMAIGPVPEPCTLLLLGLGAMVVRKRR